MTRTLFSSLGLLSLLALHPALAAPPDRAQPAAQAEKDNKGGTKKGSTKKGSSKPATPPAKPTPDRDIGVPQAPQQSWPPANPPAQPQTSPPRAVQQPAPPSQPAAPRAPQSGPSQSGPSQSGPPTSGPANTVQQPAPPKEADPRPSGLTPTAGQPPASSRPTEPASTKPEGVTSPVQRPDGGQATPGGELRSKPSESSGPRPDGLQSISGDDHAKPGQSPVAPRSNLPAGVNPSRPVAGDNEDLRRAHGAPPPGGARPYAGPPAHHVRPAHSTDHRYARPDPHHVRPNPHAPHGPPPYWYYRPYYTHWYVHPYYRHVHASWVVVYLDFPVSPWVVTWAPPPRAGWVWVGGYWSPVGVWVPGYWQPVAPAPIYRSTQYVYVPGWWQGDIYVEGYWRVQGRAGWTWVDGYYLPDGTFVRGAWQPSGNGPAGYVWEPGFFDGDQWIEGFWRPEFRSGYSWSSSWYDSDGAYHAGYWEPTEDRPGQVWVPGWFDGSTWIEGYWVTDAEYRAADPVNYQPDKGWNDGWDDPDADSGAEGDEAPLAIPISPE